MGRIANGRCERIRRMVGTRHVLERQQLLDHVLNLFLFSGARSDNSELDLLRRKLTHLHAGVRAGNERRAARLARGERRRDVLAEPNGLDSDARRPITLGS